MNDTERNHEPAADMPPNTPSSNAVSSSAAANAPATGIAAADVSGLGANGVPTVGGAPGVKDVLKAAETSPNITPKPCVECGGAMIEVDVAGGDARPALIRDNFGRFFSRDSLVPLERAHGCTHCGYVRLFVDPDKLRKRAAPRTSG